MSLLLIFTFVLSFLPVYAYDITPENLNEPNISINENDTNETIEETTINEEITIVPEEDDAPDGTVTTYTFDTRNNITRESIAHPTGYDFVYDYPSHDYSTSIDNVTSHTIDYTYSSANQLLRETENLNDGEFEGYNDYTYDLKIRLLSYFWR